MCSVRVRRFFHSFCLRLALHHMLVASLVLMAVLFVSFRLIRLVATSESRRHLTEALNRAQMAYLGRQFSPPVVSLPEPIRQRIESRFPGIRIGFVEKEKQPKGWMYEVLGTVSNSHLEILTVESGELWVASTHSIQEVYDSMKQNFGSLWLEGFSLYIYSPDGKLLVGESVALPQKEIHRFLEQMKQQESQSILQAGSIWIGGEVMYDGNLVLIADRVDETFAFSRLWTGFFILFCLLFIPLSGLIGYYISHRAMKGVDRVAKAALRVSEGHFNERVPRGTEGTEIEALADAFNHMLDRIEALMHELRDVTSNIAHDLRTPIARIRATLESLGWEEASPDARQKLLATAIEECDRVVPLIDSVLELARAEAGALVLQNEKYDLCAEVAMAHEIFSAIAEERAISFKCTLPEEPILLFGDRARMQRVISNLVDNALKFTPAGGTVSLILNRDEQHISLRVSDTGKGFSKEELDRAFERFYRGDKSRSSGGFGMGLSMVKAFISAFGGTVEIESKEGTGCTIIILLPLPPVSA